MLATSVWRATMSITANMILMEESLWGAPKRPVCCIVGTQRIDRWGQSLQDYIPTQLYSLMCFAGKHGSVWRYQLPLEKDFCHGCSMLIQIFEQFNCTYATNIGFLAMYEKNNAVLILLFTSKHEPKTTKFRKAMGRYA